MEEEPEGEGEHPVVLDGKNLSKNEKEKVKRLCTPKRYSGKVEVPQDIAEMWNAPGGKEKLFQLWAKSGGIKVSA